MSLTLEEVEQMREVRDWFHTTLGSPDQPGHRWRFGFYNVYFEHENELFAFRMRWL